MDRFSRMHPAALLLFFAVSLIAPLSFSNPFIDAAALLGALLYAFSNGEGKRLKTLLFAAAAVALTALFNMLFAHYGADALFTVKGVNFTLEALVYGLHQGAVLAVSLLWFTALGRCLDSEKLLYLLRFAPKLALLFSMVLGFIPRFLSKLTDIREAQLALHGGRRERGIRQKLRASLDVFSALISYSLESSIITADSMKARGYNPKAVRHGRFRMKTGDALFMCITAAVGIYVFTEKAVGNFQFLFDPMIVSRRLSVPALLVFTVLELLPALMNLEEAIRWKRLSTVKA